VAVKFIAWKEKLYQYVQNDGNYSGKVATIFKGQNSAAEQLPNPPDGNDPPWHEKKAWKDERKRVQDRNDKLVDDKKKVYAFMLGQCSETLKQKLSARGSWKTVDTAQDPNRLLTLIDRVCMTPGMFTRAERMNWAMQTYYSINQSRICKSGGFPQEIRCSPSQHASV
jgi:hypothetical protein